MRCQELCDGAAAVVSPGRLPATLLSLDRARLAAEGDWGDCQRLRGITGTYDPDQKKREGKADMNSTLTTHTPRLALAAATVVLALLLLAVAPQAAAAAPPDKQPLHSFDTEEPITGAFSMLDRSDDAIASKIRTAATPGICSISAASHSGARFRLAKKPAERYQSD